MRKVLYPLATVAILSGLFAFIQPAKKAKGIVWEKKVHDFGNVKIGPDVEATYAFTNKTKVDLEIDQVAPSCGCTSGDYSKGIIKKNKKGYVKLIYHTAGRMGFFQKYATVKFKNDSTYQLSFKGTVVSE